MEQQAGYWMWRKRRNDLSCHDLESSTNILGTTYYESWEEQAFAEDAGGGGGAGCIWPPRSYCCSFCGREFRSAQALGGHMNVHRRDRARLKQSSSPTPHRDDLHQNIQNPLLPMGFQCQTDEVCNPNPNSNHGGSTGQQTCVVDPFSSPILVQERAKKSQKYPWSNLAADNRYYHFSDLRTDEGEEDNSPRILRSEYVQTDLSESKQGTCSVGCKRKRSDHTPTTTLLPFFLKPISIERHHHIHSPSEDDIDLELRLGDQPKVPRHGL